MMSDLPLFETEQGEQITQLQADLAEAEREVERSRSVINTQHDLMVSAERRGVKKGQEESTETIDSLQARVDDLSKKLDQALEHLTVEQRAMILCQWGAV